MLAVTDQSDESQYQYDEPIPDPVGVELNASNDEFGEGIDASKEIGLESPGELKQTLKIFKDVFSENGMISDQQRRVIELSLDTAFTSLEIDGYDDHKIVEEWRSHEEIESPNEYEDYLNSLAQRIHAASDVPDGAWHPAVMDIIDIGTAVREGEYTLEEGKSRMRQIDVSEELRDP